ncbi:hypothetical protein GJE22_00440 [Enorma sp. HF-1365]|uniref:Streptococcal pilin isopeptide linkage domain-containing protein n=1 Tax=Enorma shizhengliae TaxID=2606615 RepID=A0A7K0G5K1_9ACTN|nr:hypothetical protein [Enorma shizhengliae]
MPRAIGLAVGGALVSLGADEVARLLLEQAVQHLLDGLADELPQVGPQGLLVQCYDGLGHGLLPACFFSRQSEIIPGRAVPSFLSGRYAAVKVRKKLYVTIAFREVSYQLAGSKVLETNGYAGETLADGEYAFALYEVGADGSETKIEEVSNGTPNGDAASFQFSPITYTEAGTHTYKVYELGTDGQPGTGGTDADNVFYSTAVYTVTVTVTQSNDGRGLSASAQVTDAEGATASDVLFTNTYTPKEVVVGTSGSAQIGGTKTLAVSDGADCALAEGEFTFVLLDANGDEVRRVTNAADGSFVFDDLTFDAAGTYSYTVAEVNGSAGGIGYDDSLFAVTVKVTEDTDANALVADVSYAKDGATVDAVSFENTYTAASTTASIGAFKQLNGGTLADGQFTFELAGSEGAPMPEGAQDGVATAASAADGTVSFRKGDLAKRLGCGGRLPRGW